MATTVAILLQPIRTGKTGGFKTGRSIKFVFVERNVSGRSEPYIHRGTTSLRLLRRFNAMWTGIYVNETVERRNFRRRVQQPGETFDDFLIALRDLECTEN